MQCYPMLCSTLLMVIITFCLMHGMQFSFIIVSQIDASFFVVVCFSFLVKDEQASARCWVGVPRPLWWRVGLNHAHARRSLKRCAVSLNVLWCMLIFVFVCLLFSCTTNTTTITAQEVAKLTFCRSSWPSPALIPVASLFSFSSRLAYLSHEEGHRLIKPENT